MLEARNLLEIQMSEAPTPAQQQAQQLAQRYIALWNEPDAQRRNHLLQALWHEEGRYMDPMMQASGHAQIDALITAVQQRFPGFRFTLAEGSADGHADRLRFSWHLGPAGAQPAPIRGTDFATLHGGRLLEVTGFIDALPEAA